MSESFTPRESPERWLPVVGWEGLYEVSDLGRVRSLPRRGGNNRIYGGQILKHYIGSGTRGYPVVGLSRDGVQGNHLVHRLVLGAFVGPCPEGQEARHGPAGKTDASLANLCFGTRSENIRDRVRDGQDQRGERYGGAKLTWAAVAEIRSRVAAGEQQTRLAREFGVSISAVWLVVHGHNWRYPPS